MTSASTALLCPALIKTMNELTFNLPFYWDLLPAVVCFVMYGAVTWCIARCWISLWNKSWCRRYKPWLICSVIATSLVALLPTMNRETARKILEEEGGTKLENKLIHINIQQLEKLLKECNVPSNADKTTIAQEVFTMICKRTLEQSASLDHALLPCNLTSPQVPERLIGDLNKLYVHRTYSIELENIYKNGKDQLRAAVASAISKEQKQQHEKALIECAEANVEETGGILLVIMLALWGTLAVKDIRVISPVKM